MPGETDPCPQRHVPQACGKRASGEDADMRPPKDEASSGCSTSVSEWPFVSDFFMPVLLSHDFSPLGYPWGGGDSTRETRQVVLPLRPSSKTKKRRYGGGTLRFLFHGDCH